MTHYLGLDWLAMVLTFTAIHLLANLDFFSLNVRGFLKWAPTAESAGGADA